MNEYIGTEVDEEFNTSDFTSIGENWNITGNLVENTYISECAGKNVFGGFETFSGETIVTKNLIGLPEHDFIRIYFKAYFIDR